MLTLAEIQTRAYATAKAKGWHDRPLRETHYVTRRGDLDADVVVNHDRVLAKHALIHTELTEAQEAIDEGHVALYFGEGDKPEGLPAEIADVVIRVCDTTEALGLTLNVLGGDEWLSRVHGMRPAIEIRQSPGWREKYETATIWLARVRQYVDQATEAARVDAWNEYAERMSIAVMYSAAIVIGYGQDMESAIVAKMDYNDTRPHRHGGKQA